MASIRKIEFELDKYKAGVRIPTAKSTVWHRDKKRYSRKVKHSKSIGGQYDKDE